MSMIIMGVLFVVALLAIIAMIIILRSETNTQTGAPAQRAGTDAQRPSLERVEISQRPPTRQAPAALHNGATQTTVRVADRHFIEVVDELHALQQRVQEFEYRLAILREAVERSSFGGGSHFPREEDEQKRSDVSSTN